MTSTTQNTTATTTTAKTTKTETTTTKTTSSVTTRPNNNTGKFELYILDKNPTHSEYLSGIATLENDGGIIALGRKYTEPEMPPTAIIDKLDKNFKIVKSVAINNATAVDIWSDSNNYIVKLYGETSGHHFYRKYDKNLNDLGECSNPDPAVDYIEYNATSEMGQTIIQYKANANGSQSTFVFTSRTDNNEDFMIVKLENGKEVWKKLYGGSGSEWCEGAYIDKSGYLYAIVASDSKDGIFAHKSIRYSSISRYLVKLDDNGNILFNTAITRAGMGISEQFGIMEKNGVITVAGYSQYEDGILNKYPSPHGKSNFVGFVMTLDKDGVIKNVDIFPTDINFRGYKIVILESGKVVFPCSYYYNAIGFRVDFNWPPAKAIVATK